MLKRLDDGWYRLERWAVVGGFLLMSAAVFADVVHRVFADDRWQTPARLAVVWGAFFLISLGGVRTASRAAGWTRSLLIAAAVTALWAVVVYGFVWLMPSGLVWSQTLALVLMIWVAFLGASIATRQHKHLKVDAAERLFKGEAKRWVGAYANALAALATGSLAVLAVQYCRYHYGIYVETEGLGGSFEGLPVPRFLGYAVLPLSLFTMAARFLGQAVQAARGRFHDPEAPEITSTPDGSGASR